jgi:hypothetical protein
MSYISIDLELPDHTKELKDCEEYIKSIKKEFKLIGAARKFPTKQFAALYERITRGLYYVGSLSTSAFETEDIIQETYFKNYRHAPELAKKLWQEHYGNVHKPYNTIKNRFYRLYEEIDSLYMKINKCTAPH